MSVVLRFAFVLVAASAAALQTGEATAANQDAEPSSPPAASVLFETATVIDRALESTTASGSVVTAAEIDALMARDPADALDFVAGVSIGRGPRGSLNAAEVRGGDPNFTLVLVDGVPLNDPTDTLGGAFSLASASIAGLERIEVARGPASSVYGSTALAGAVQLFTAGGGDRLGASIDVEGGDHDLLRASSTVGGPITNGVSGSLSLAREEEEGRHGDDRFELSTALGGLDVELEEGSALGVRGRFADWQADDYPTGSGGPLLGLGLLRRSEHREASLAVDLQHAQGDRLRHHWTATFYRHDVDRSSPPLPPQVPPSVEETTFDQARLLYASSLATGDSSFAFGAELEREEGDNRSLLLLPPSFGGPLAGDYSRRRSEGGIFGEAIRSFDGDWGSLSLEAGARLDLPEDTASQLSPRLGLSYRPGESVVRLRGSIGRAFKQPSFFALDSPPQLGGNPDLRPEVSWGADVGVEAATGRTLRAALTLFSNRYRDLIDFDFATFRLVNRDRVEASGAELSLSWRPNGILDLDLSATAQNVEDEETGQEILRRAESFGRLRLTVRPHRRLLAAFDLRHDGDRFDQTVAGPRRELDGVTLIGAALTVELAPRFDLRIRGDNLGDESYRVEIGLPGGGRSLRVGIRYRLGREEP